MTPDIGIIGGADGPTAIMVSSGGISMAALIGIAVVVAVVTAVVVSVVYSTRQ